MYLHRSNRAEALVKVLAEVVARPLPEPTAAECIVVQGRGMERWLSMELSRRFGVWANADFAFPRKLIERAIAAVLGDAGAPAPGFAPETMMWSVADLLPTHLERPECAPIRRYLAGDARGLKRIQLAERIATTFDQYVVYRPKMVLDWERGEGTDWQAVLWRALVKRHGSKHIAARAAAFLDTLGGRSTLDGFPTRVSLFGVSTLPPLYLELLAALSRLVEVHLFVLSPSREYWADIQSQRQRLRTLNTQPAGTVDADVALHLEEGHPLLASLGRLGRDFQQVLECTGDYLETDADLYGDPGPGSMLTTLQSDILWLRHRGPRSEETPPLPLRPDDGSICIHACHGPMREVEVLHDQLLALFDADRTLEPHDVVVMSPAIDTYAPFIDAVFGGEHTGRPHIPYRIADRGVRVTDAVADAFARLLDLLRSRMTAPEVLDLLAIDAVRDRFRIAADEIDLVRTWVTEAGIRWGVDAAHRAAVEQPALDVNTWRFGLDRLVLGCAMPGEERELFGGVLPYDDVEGTGTELLGRLTEFCETLFGFRDTLQEPRALDAWRDDLGALLEGMVARTNQTGDQHQGIRNALDTLAERAHVGGFQEAVDLDAVRTQLDAELERAASAHGFLEGGVTCCALVPMRTIPFRVMCLLGMSDDAFPRTRPAFGFDLMAQRPRPGDRSARDDDRYLFLESLLSARERVLITYVGQSINDNSDIPPSVVVSELLDTLGESFVLPTSDSGTSNADAVTIRVVVRHPLQPFSPRYFGAAADPRLFSYAQSYCDGATALVRPRREPTPFVSTSLPLAADAPRLVTVEDLVRFFEHPLRTFVQRRLELYLDDDADEIEDREPLELSLLQQWAIGDALLGRALEGDDVRAAFAAVRATGRLPPGVLGQCAFDDVRPQVEAIASAVSSLRVGGRLPQLEIDRELDGTRISGLLRDLWPTGQVYWQYSRLGGRHELGLWIRHLLLNWAAPHEYPRCSHLVGRPTGDDTPVVVRFGPVENPQSILSELLRLYWLGQTAPLPLFARTSRAYVEGLRKHDGDVVRALAAARTAWVGHKKMPGDGEDLYVQQVIGEREPFDADFRIIQVDAVAVPGFHELACAVFEPLLDHREDAA